MAIDDSYVTADQLVEHLQITARDHDDALNRVARSASRWVEGYCHRQFNLATTATARYYDVNVNGYLFTHDIGNATISVASDTGADGTYATSWTTADFQAVPVNAISEGQPIRQLLAVGNFTYPSISDRVGLVRVTARWGWPAVPADVVEATLLQAARLFKRRESVEGVLGGGDFGVVRVGAGGDRDAVDLLEPYVIAEIGVA